MFKIFLFTLLMAIAATSASNTVGYDYQTSIGSRQPTHQAPQQHHQQIQSHNDGWEKHFYYFNAPEEHFEQKKTNVVKHITPQKVKKNLQVISIKPPEEKHHENTKKVFKKVEESTHIYLLTPEHRQATKAKQIQHAQQQQQTTVHQHKPEVHFLSYHTPAEAEQIQQMIIQQYGGKPSEIVHNVGSGPVVNFINSKNINVPQYQQHQQHHYHQQQPQQRQQQQHHVTSESVNRQYLAPAEPARVENVNVPQYHQHHQQHHHHQQQSQQQQQQQHHVTSESANRQYLAPAEPARVDNVNVPQYQQHQQNHQQHYQQQPQQQPQPQHHQPQYHRVTSESVNRQYLGPAEPARVENVNVPQYQQHQQNHQQHYQQQSQQQPQLQHQQPQHHHVTSESVNRQYLAPAEPARIDLAIDKNYATNCLPSDIDVVPGRSYIPIL